MLHLLDESIEAFLRSEVPLGARDVDVAFDAPDKEWVSKLSRPTVNLFLWDMSRSSERMHAGMRQVEKNGQLSRGWAPIPVEFRYLITAWTSEHSDEHQLLGNLLVSILANKVFPQDYLATGLSDIGEITMTMSSSGDRLQTDLWKALDGQLKPGIDLVLTLRIDASVYEPVAAPPSGVDVATTDTEGSGQPSVRRRVAGEVVDPDAIGALVRAPHAVTTVNEAGRFLVQAEVGDEIVVETDPPKIAIVPENGGVVLT